MLIQNLHHRNTNEHDLNLIETTVPENHFIENLIEQNNRSLEKSGAGGEPMHTATSFFVLVPDATSLDDAIGVLFRLENDGFGPGQPVLRHLVEN